MISEKKLAYYERLASKADEATAKAIEQLVDEVRKLEREADWLALECATHHPPKVNGVYVCHDRDCDNILKPDEYRPCAQCWRAYAKGGGEQ